MPALDAARLLHWPLEVPNRKPTTAWFSPQPCWTIRWRAVERYDMTAAFRWLLLVMSMAYASGVAPAHACPNCPAAEQARRQVWRDRFADNLAVAALPFIIIGAVCARAHGIGRQRQDES
jgi:hypothetical protein